MATEAVTMRLRLRDELSAPLRRVRGELDRATTSFRRLGQGRLLPQVGGLGTAFGALGKSLQRLNPQLKNLSDRLLHGVTRSARTAATALGAVTAAATFFAVRTAADLEQTNIAFAGFLGSAERGKALFDDLKALNLRTPFELTDITAGARQLLGFGFAGEQILPIMEQVVDVAAGLGAGSEGLSRILLNLGQIRAAGKVTGRELRDFATLGFPGYEAVATILGKTRGEIEALGEDFTVSGDKFFELFLAGGGPFAKFAGMAEQQMNSVRGLWSNFVDVLSLRLADAASPLVTSIKETLPQATALVGTALDTIGPPLLGVVGQLLNLLTKAIPVAAPLLSALAAGAGRLLDVMAPAFGGLEPVMDRLVVSVGGLVDALAPAMPNLVDLFVALVGVLPAFVDLLAALVPIVTPVAQLASALLGLEPVRDVMAQLLLVLLGYKALSGVAGAITAFNTALRGTAVAQAQVNATTAAGGGAGGLGRWGSRLGGAGLVVGGLMQGTDNLGGAAATVAGGAMIGGPIGALAAMGGIAVKNSAQSIANGGLTGGNYDDVIFRAIEKRAAAVSAEALANGQTIDNRLQIGNLQINNKDEANEIVRILEKYERDRKERG